MSYVGRSVPRVDARDKAAGRAMYAADLCDRRALTAKILHAEQAHALVNRIDAEKARAMDGVEAVFTCFDVPKNYFPTAGHPWSTEPEHQDVADRLLLTDHVRFWGDEIAVVVAQDELTAQKALREIEVEYEPLPFVLDVQKAMEPGAPQLHEAFPGNVLGHSSVRMGDYEAAIKEPGLIKVEGWYDTPTVQHCHIENHNCWAYMEGGRVVVVTSTQIPHIVRRIVGQALGIPWGQVRIIKPYIGGGFGNKQDALYEPLCAWLTTQLGGRPVRIECAREETFHCNRVRHAIRSHIISWVRPDGSFAARKLECWSNQGAYASHGHGIAAKGMNSFPQIYPCPNIECDSWTAFTNLPPAGAMRGYGIPQATFAGEAHIDDVAKALNMNPLELRRRIAMPKGYKDEFSKNVNWSDSFRACMEAGAKATDFERLHAEYSKPQTGDIRRGVGMALYWYNTGVWPISLESSSCRMVLNQDGSIQVQTGETEIGQGCDTVYAQMAADAVGVPFGSVHVVSSQDTDVTPLRQRGLRLAPDLCGRLCHQQDGPHPAGEDIELRPQADAPARLEPRPRGGQADPYAGRRGAHVPRGAGDGGAVLDGGQPPPHCRGHGTDKVQRLLLRLLLRRGGGGYEALQGQGPAPYERTRLRQAGEPQAR